MLSSIQLGSSIGSLQGKKLPFTAMALDSKFSESVLHQYLLRVPETHTGKVHPEGGLLTTNSYVSRDALINTWREK